MHSIQSTLRSQLGALYHDVPRFLWRVESPVGGGWSSYCNRHEKLEVGPDGLGRSCCWKWTSDLYLPTVFPGIGRRLLRKCIRQWPISTACSPKEPPSKSPKVSFVIGHRGRTRLPNLLITVASIAAQDLDTVECIVVEQSPFRMRELDAPRLIDSLKSLCRGSTASVCAALGQPFIQPILTNGFRSTLVVFCLKTRSHAC